MYWIKKQGKRTLELLNDIRKKNKIIYAKGCIYNHRKL